MTDLIEVPFCDLCQQTKPGSLLGVDGQSMKWYGRMREQLPRFFSVCSFLAADSRVGAVLDVSNPGMLPQRRCMAHVLEGGQPGWA